MKLRYNRNFCIFSSKLTKHEQNMIQKYCFVPISLPFAQHRFAKLASMSSVFLYFTLCLRWRNVALNFYSNWLLPAVQFKMNEYWQWAVSMNKLAFYAFILHGNVRLRMQYDMQQLNVFQVAVRMLHFNKFSEIPTKQSKTHSTCYRRFNIE